MKLSKIFLSVAALSAMCAQAESFEAGGIHFTTTGANSVKVDRVPADKAVTSPYKGVYIIPEQVYFDGANYNVTAIADSAFYQSKATEIQVPNSVKTIGEGAFAYASDLTSVTLPLNLNAVSKLMLAGTSVVNVAVPEGVKNIGWGAFQSCGLLHTMLLPSTTKKIEAYGYNNCHNLYEIYCAAPAAPEASGWAIFIGLSGIDVIVPDEEAVEKYAANAIWGNEETFTLYPSEDVSISMTGEVEKYNDQYMRFALGNNLAYKIYKGDEQIALTAADYYYVPITAEGAEYTIVPTDMMNDADPTTVIIEPSAVKNVIADYDLPKVYGRDGAIHIHGNTHGDMVTVFDMYGRLCFRRHTNGDEVITLDKGIYIVLVGNHPTKVRL
ncbi:MAG: leucine-rich repeat domain-containing protein [Muribaculaceae bacterium]|nr:leucine-rich repeat domain-containing protein [Muribaculaceae bacterium]